jgi:cyclopropane-fatty-acyl-phospholipid synthase
MAEMIAPRTQKVASLRRSRLREAILRWLLRHLTFGSLTLRDEAGVRRYGEGLPHFDVTVHDVRTYSALVKSGSVGFGESYTEGWWQVEDLTAFIQFVIRNMDPLLHTLDVVARALAPLSAVARRFQRVNKAKDKANIIAHYDLGNEFYSLMLDPTMMYSCAYFASMEVSLEEASLAKLRLLLDTLDLHPDDHLVEIGTGWGGLAVFAAETYGCRVTSVTISDAQFAYATDLVARRGLTERVTILNRDYRDLSGTFDKLVSVEMIEAIGWRQLPTYFATCASLIKPDGLMALQAIVIDDVSYERTKNSEDFIKNMIFPGGFLPSVEAIQSTATSVSDLRLLRARDIGRHYAETLKRWRENLATHQAAYDALGLDASFQRMWDMYLRYCEAAFLERHVSDVQFLFAKREWREGIPASGVEG